MGAGQRTREARQRPVRQWRTPRDSEPVLADTRLQTLQQQLLAWYAVNQRDVPWRKTRDPYAILVSEVMLQQTQVERVIPKYLEFLDRFPDFQTLASATRGDVIRAWAPRSARLARRLVKAARYPRSAPEPQSLNTCIVS